jgi:hypothetical protein
MSLSDRHGRGHVPGGCYVPQLHVVRPDPRQLLLLFFIIIIFIIIIIIIIIESISGSLITIRVIVLVIRVARPDPRRLMLIFLLWWVLLVLLLSESLSESPQARGQCTGSV